MKSARPLAQAAVSLLFAAALGACGQSGKESAGTGGTVGQGGGPASGGETSSGGALSSGGATVAGGTVGTGGTSGRGGTPAGGTVGAGGVTSSGGQSGAGNGGSAGSSVAGASGAGGRSGNGGATTVGNGGAGTGAGGIGGRASGGSSGTGAAGASSSSAGGAAGASSPGTGGAAGNGAGGGGGSTGGGGSVVGGNSGTGGGSSPTVDCTDTSTTKLSFTKQYDGGSIAVTGSTKTYYSATNWWYKFGGQAVGINGLSMTIDNSKGVSVPASDGNPTGFPTIYIGAYSGHETVGSNLPKQVSAIKSVPTIFQSNASTLDTSNFNATYDVWFTASGNKLTSAMSNNPGKGGAYLMVWMYKPQDRQPRGGVAGPNSTGGALDSPNYAGHTVDGLPGTWDVWVDPSDPLCISYVSSTPMDGLAFDLNDFIQDSVTNKYGITSSMYLNLVFGGFEIWSGGDGLALKQFCAAVN